MRISENDLADARQSWGDGLIKISQIFESSGIDEAKSFASSLTDNLYGFDLGPILFKPTLSGGPKTFRKDKEVTLSYFVGQTQSTQKILGLALNIGEMFALILPTYLLKIPSLCGWGGYPLKTKMEKLPRLIKAGDIKKIPKVILKSSCTTPPFLIKTSALYKNVPCILRNSEIIIENAN